MRRPAASTRSPSALSSRRRPTFRNSGRPHCASSRFSCKLTADSVRPTRRDARARVPVSCTRERVRSSSRSSVSTGGEVFDTKTRTPKLENCSSVHQELRDFLQLGPTLREGPSPRHPGRPTNVRRPVMPFIHVRYSTPVEQDLRQPIATFLTETTARVLRKKPEVTAVAVEQVPVAHWFIGG